jgi:hypothetical protein
MRHLHLPIIESARRAFREAICPICAQRPHGSEALPPTVARSCEPNCPLFLHLAKLKVVAEEPAAHWPPDYETAIRGEICNTCLLRETSGDFCAERLTCTCPLTRFAGQAIAILEGLTYAERAAKERSEKHERELKAAKPLKEVV